MAVGGTRRKRDEDELTANLRQSLEAVRSMAAAYLNQDERAFMAAAKELAELTVERLRGS